MKNARRPLSLRMALVAPICFFLAACSALPTIEAVRPAPEEMQVSNPVFHFEIPVADMDRAVRFYEAVFLVELRRETVDGYEMAFFPRAADQPGASGALAKGDVYVPTKSGVIIYFDVSDIDAALDRAVSMGARTLYPKKAIGAAGYVAEIEDSEGNRIALNEFPG